jgi:hypothetical protein
LQESFIVIKVIQDIHSSRGGVSMWEYTDKVKEHFLNPRNAGEVESPDGVAEVGSDLQGERRRENF